MDALLQKRRSQQQGLVESCPDPNAVIPGAAIRLAGFAPRSSISLSRCTGFIAGVATQALFALTVVYLFSFLRYGPERQLAHWFGIDLLLALQFAVPHSWLLHPKTRKLLSPWIRPEFHGLLFCACTCISLMLIFAFWRTTNVVVWEASGITKTALLGGFYLSWVSLLYSISLTGLGYQTGWTQWTYWYAGSRMPLRTFQPRSLYACFRHPVYLSFLGLIWFTPRMTLDHAVLTAVWTVYIYVGSILKDERLAFYLGSAYRDYQRIVPGYPLLRRGPLGILRTAAPTECLNSIADKAREDAVRNRAA